MVCKSCPKEDSETRTVLTAHTDDVCLLLQKETLNENCSYVQLVDVSANFNGTGVDDQCPSGQRG